MLRGDGVWRGKPGETAAFHCVLGIRSKAFLKAKVGLSPLPGPPLFLYIHLRYHNSWSRVYSWILTLDCSSHTQWLVVYRAFVSGAKVSIVDLTCSWMCHQHRCRSWRPAAMLCAVWSKRYGKAMAPEPEVPTLQFPSPGAKFGTAYAFLTGSDRIPLCLLALHLSRYISFLAFPLSAFLGSPPPLFGMDLMPVYVHHSLHICALWWLTDLMHLCFLNQHDDHGSASLGQLRSKDWASSLEENSFFPLSE
jgi:hypothetical protein